MCSGHVFCKSCLDAMKEIKSMVYNKCPVCRGEDFVTFPNKQIEKLRVFVCTVQTKVEVVSGKVKLTTLIII